MGRQKKTRAFEAVTLLVPTCSSVQTSFEPPDERLERVGIAALSDAEVSALVLGGTTALAERLLTTFGSLRALRQATTPDLITQLGICP